MKTALVEISNSHSECLYSQIAFLKDAGHEVTLVISSGLRDQVSDFKIIDRVVEFEIEPTWKSLLGVWKYLRSENFNFIILNTAQGPLMKKLLLFPLGNAKVLGTLHNLKKLKSGLTQKVINHRVDHYFVLNDYLLNKIPGDFRKSVSSYYSIFFPSFNEIDLGKKADEKWVVIPGQAERKRRDYDRLFSELRRTPLKKNIKLIILGRSMHKHGDGPWIKEQITELGLMDQIVTFDTFISNDLFHSYLKNADIIMPLIHPDSLGFDMYVNGQISGAFNMAFAYKKLMLIEESFKSVTDFQDTSMFYKAHEMIEKIGEALESSPRTYQSEKWNYDQQKKNYLHHLSSPTV